MLLDVPLLPVPEVPVVVWALEPAVLPVPLEEPVVALLSSVVDGVVIDGVVLSDVPDVPLELLDWAKAPVVRAVPAISASKRLLVMIILPFA